MIAADESRDGEWFNVHLMVVNSKVKPTLTVVSEEAARFCEEGLVLKDNGQVTSDCIPYFVTERSDLSVEVV